MKILLTGNKGMIGYHLEKQLIKDGYEVVGYDIKDNKDICNQSDVILAGKGCNVIINLAALLGNDEKESDEEITRVNLLGTFNILESARVNNVKKVIHMSSVDSLGVFAGDDEPIYFPIDDDHPCVPTTSYAISKKISEEMCESFSKLNKIPVVCLRPPGVWNDEFYVMITKARKIKPKIEYSPYWEYGAFIDVRDLVDITIKCVITEFNGYICGHVTSDDIQSTGYTALELTKMLLPNVEFKDIKRYENDPFTSLIDCSKIKNTFNWKPKYTWKKYLSDKNLIKE